MSTETWARNEIDFVVSHIEEDEISNGYYKACAESAYNALKSLLDDGHSGASIKLTQQILNRLIDGKPLTAIEDDEDIWEYTVTPYKSKYTSYSCKRMSGLYRHIYKDGTIRYVDIHRVVCYNIGSNVSYYNGFISNIIHEMFPITLPYYPSDYPYSVYVEEILSDPNNGDFDTFRLSHVITPEGKELPINRYFKETKNSFEEIDVDEWLERKAKSSKGR